MKNNTIFATEYKKLNKAQKEAVDAIDGPVMVIAGPGTGKTTVLTLRIANILKETDTPASGILALTYTDAGVRRMREKLREVIGTRAHEVEIHTFHSFAAAMIAEYPDHFLHIQGMRQLTDVEQEIIIRNIISNPKYADLRPAGKPDAYLFSIGRGIDASKREAETPESIRAFVAREIERINNDEDSISTRGATKGKLKATALDELEKCRKTFLFADIYEEYEAYKKENSLMDFNDLIIELLLAMRNDELLLRLIQERFLYLLVDEHQDTNDSQNLIIALISEFFDTPNLFIVGDEKQAIYRFQGASVENFLKLREKWPAMKLISLDKNYRSHQHILDAGFSMIENNYEEGEHADLRIKLSAGGKEKPRPIDVVTAENTPALENHLAKEVKSIVESEPEATVAVIVRRNRDLEQVIKVLELAGVPVSSERSIDIFHHPVGMIFFDLLTYLSDSSRLDALGRTLTAGMWGLDFDQSAALFKDLRAGKDSSLAEIIPALSVIQKEMLEDGPINFLILAGEASGFSDIVARDPNYVHVWKGITTLAESLVREQKLTSPRELIEALLAYRQSAEMRAVKVSVGAPDLPVKAMTAHGSKGLEFDCVFIPYANDESWVGKNRGASFVLPRKRASESDVRDIRRLFYVALTRARKHATILSSLAESDGKELSPLRFISELDPKTISHVSVAKVPASARSNSLQQTGGSRALADLAKKVLLDTGLSPTALNHFLECENKYLYESILKMPQAPSITAEKGTAMHEAIAKVWQSEDRSVEHIEKTLLEVTTRFLDDSLLPLKDKESTKARLANDIPLVARELAPHFGEAGTIYTEKWMRAMYGYLHEGGHKSVPLHGKLDAIIDKGEAVSVFDYKTKQGMSEAEIRGETKGSDGNYFRQLAFYKLLVESDRRFGRRKSSYSLVFVSPDKKGRCPIVTLPVLETDVKRLEEEIKTLIDSVLSGKIGENGCNKDDCEYCNLKTLLK